MFCSLVHELVANKVVEDVKRRDRKALVLQLDFEKACDGVSLSF